MTRINWTPVMDNSSSVDAIAEYARGASIAYAQDLAWDPRVKRILSQLGRMGARKGRARAKGWYNRNFS